MQDESSISPRPAAYRGGYAIPSRWVFNDCRIEGNAAFLTLRDKHKAPCGEAIVDLWDLERVRQAACWGRMEPQPGLIYARGALRGGLATPGERRPALYLHRFILDAAPEKMVDHWNGNGLDCRRENLRLTDNTGNQRNKLGHRRVRELETAMRDLLRCPHQGQQCDCKRRALELLSRTA